MRREVKNKMENKGKKKEKSRRRETSLKKSVRRDSEAIEIFNIII